MAQDDKAADERDAFGRIFTLKSDLRQRDVTVFNRAYVAYPPGRAAVADDRQASLQAAIEAGWIESPATSFEDVTDGATGKKSRRFYFDGVEVEDMLPSEVFYYGRLCSRHFDAAMAIPKASSSP
jgi:hypothetical protein